MKKVLILSVLMILVNWSFAENENTRRILDAWRKMHNAGTEQAVKSFIKEYYSPDLLSSMKNFDDHVNFYMTLIKDFGDIQETVYKTEESTKNRLKVQLLKEGSLLFPEPGPEEILVVEIDLDPENPRYLKRGLGMGALICYIKR